MRKLWFLISRGLTVLLFAPTMVVAQQPTLSMPVDQTQANTGRPAFVNPARAPCGRELQQYCSGVQPGGGRLVRWLWQQSDLSGRYKMALQKAAGCTPEAGRVVQCVTPSDTDPAIKRFDRINYVLFNEDTGPDANLLLFLTGTGGIPPGPRRFLHEAADAGYRVISLDYNDEPAVAQFCPRRPPACAGNFRRERIYGLGTPLPPSIENTAAETIVNRLVKLLIYLDRQDPRHSWAGYLADGAPNWRRIAVAGQSQGAGMAAYIAKTQTVARVILFSGGFDFVIVPGIGWMPSPWLRMPSKTPPERWFAGYNAREKYATLLAAVYAALRIPATNVRVFNRPMPAAQRAWLPSDPFHVQGIESPTYVKERAFFLGRSS